MAEIVSEVRTNKRILLLIAMEAEASPFLSSISSIQQVESTIPNAPFVISNGVHNNCELTVITNGKCRRFNVDNVGTTPGTAGGFKSKGAVIGDVFLSTNVSHHDRRIPIPGFDVYGKGNHSSIDTPNLALAHNFKRGVVTTSNSLDHTPMDDTIMRENDASVKDMEAASIAWVCEMFSIPFLAVKVVTDIVDGERPTQEEFFENLGAASRSLQAALPKIIDFVSERSLTEL